MHLLPLGSQPPVAPDHRVIKMWVEDHILGTGYFEYFLVLTTALTRRTDTSPFARRRDALRHRDAANQIGVDVAAELATFATHSAVGAMQPLRVVDKAVDKIDV
jgi:hypothetical protein